MLVTVRHYSLTSDSLTQLTIYTADTARVAVALCKRKSHEPSTLRVVAMARNGRVLCDLGRMAQTHEQNRKQLRRIHKGSERGVTASVSDSALH